MDQGVLRSTQTHSPPKGNISLSNTDMIYADFTTWLCAIFYIRVAFFFLFFVQVLTNSEIFKGHYMSTQCGNSHVDVCIFTIQGRPFHKCIFSFAETNCKRGRFGVLLHLRGISSPTQVASFPSASVDLEHTIVLHCIHFYCVAGTGEALENEKKVPHV